MSVHYKFKNSSDYNTVTFDGVHISVGDLKRAIVQQKKVGKSPDCDLQITDAESKKGRPRRCLLTTVTNNAFSGMQCTKQRTS